MISIGRRDIEHIKSVAMQRNRIENGGLGGSTRLDYRIIHFDGSANQAKSSAFCICLSNETEKPEEEDEEEEVELTRIIPIIKEIKSISIIH